MDRSTRAQVILLAVVVLVVVAAAVFFAMRVQPTAPAPAPAATPEPGETAIATPQAQSAFQVYFTTPRYPDDPKAHHGGPDEPLTQLMQSATRTLDVCDYDFDLQDVAHAMADAAGRGVKVRMVTDTD